MIYVDSRGRIYTVRGSAKQGGYKVCYGRKPKRFGAVIWHKIEDLPWRITEAEAEKDLAAYAARHGMKEEREHE